jgi:hypothetical protein
VEPAGDRVALRRRHPQVGAARVEDDLELLRGRAERDLGEICRSVLSAAQEIMESWKESYTGHS